MIALIVLNSVMMLIAYAVGNNFDSLMTAITSNVMFILYMLFSSTGQAIWVFASRIVYAVQDPFSLLTVMLYIGFLIAPLIASIITGRLSENRIHALIGFFLSTIISMLICLILVYYGFAYQILIGGAFSQSEAVMNVVLGSLVNGAIFGLVAFITTKK